MTATIPWTLEKYIFREMGKTFLLTAAAITGVLGLGGGVLEMVELGEVTTGQLFRLLGLVFPVAAALTLPIAALFSAAATYGRLSVDNEFTACRSSGINLHILFLPTVLLSVASALVTFVFVNFVIPGMVRNLNEFVGADIGAFVQQRLSRPRGITLGGKYRIYADDTAVDGTDGDRVVLQRVAFVEVDDGEWVRYGTAREVDLRFDRQASTLRAAGTLSGLSFYDRRAERFAELEKEVIPANELPTLVPLQIKFLNLTDLLYYWAKPGRWHEVANALQKLRAAVGRRLVYDTVLAGLRADGGLILRDGETRYVISSASAQRLTRDAGIELTNTTIEEDRGGRRRSFHAGRANIDVTKGDTLAESGIRLEAFEVRVRDGQSVVERAKEGFGPIPLPPEVIAQLDKVTDQDLLAAKVEGTEGEPLFDRVAAAQRSFGSTVRRIKATISERLAFSVSVFVLVILGAALGIVFRGAHVVIAFGISFLPALVVIILIVTGRQMACNAGTHLLGLSLIWMGLIAVGLLDWWVLTRWVRR